MADNDVQRAVLAALPKISASFSMAGSIWIVVEVAAHKVKRQQVYHRILLAMSIYDILESMWNFASTWPIPESTPDIHNASGTTVSCTFQGFFLQLGLAIPIYNAWLSVYYYLLIGENMTERQIRQAHWEWIMHSSAFLLAFGTAFASIFLDLYNNANLWCWIAPLPSGCDTDGNTTCERGDNANIYRWAFYFGPLWTCLVVAMVFVVAIYLKVRSLETARPRRQSTRVSIRQTTIGNVAQKQSQISNNEEPKEEGDSSYLGTRDGQDAVQESGEEDLQDDVSQDDNFREGGHRNRNTQQVLHQCLWYLAAFYMTHLFSTINRILQLTKDTTYFPLLVLHAIFDPLQGWLNFLVYRRPLYMRYRRSRPYLPRYKCWYLAFRWHFTYNADQEQAEVAAQKNRLHREQVRAMHRQQLAEYALQDPVAQEQQQQQIEQQQLENQRQLQQQLQHLQLIQPDRKAASNDGDNKRGKDAD